jgi:Arc/MetJ-type ribon-helix-helix transcriptional regulator
MVGETMADFVQFPVRFPRDIKAWIEEQAEKNGSSQNSEVIRALRDRMERTSPAATRDQN